MLFQVLILYQVEIETYIEQKIVDFACFREAISSLQLCFPLRNCLLRDFYDDRGPREFSFSFNSINLGCMTDQFVVGIIDFLEFYGITALEK